MAATEPVQGGPYPEPSDPPDGPNQMAAIVTWAAPRTVMRFASTTARDSAIPSPVEGMIAITGTGTGLRQWLYADGGWQDVTVHPWRDYTPALTTPTGTPTLGSGGTLVGRYTRIGSTVIGRAILTLGSGFATGSGSLRISLPVAGVASQFIGDARIRANNTYTRAQVLCQGDYVIFRYYNAAVNASTPDVSLSASNPAPFIAGDQIHAEFTYEAAS